MNGCTPAMATMRFRRLELAFAQCAVTFEAGDRLALAHAPAHLVALDLGIEIAELEARQPVLRGGARG
jgi:hypothetical protein